MSIVTHEVSVDQTAPLHHEVVGVVHTDNLAHRLFQRHVDVQHFLVVLALLVVHEHESKGSLHEGPALSTFLKHGGTARVMWGWFPSSTTEVGTSTIVDVEHCVNHTINGDLSDRTLALLTSGKVSPKVSFNMLPMILSAPNNSTN